MASINYGAREISVKIVYYGPGLSGKTTNLQIIHRKIPPEHKSDMVSLATETDRTLFFDFLPLDLGTIKGFSTKFQLYTVPGQVYYNATRKLVLRGVDGVVFVADSGADKIQENLESFQNLEDNLAEYHYKREEVPIIIQYNKRDLPNALTIEELQQYINRYNLAWSEAVANKGIGVFDSLKLIGKIVIDTLNKKYSRLSRGHAQQTAHPPQAMPQQQPPAGYETAPRPPVMPPPVQQQYQGFPPVQAQPAAPAPAPYHHYPQQPAPAPHPAVPFPAPQQQQIRLQQQPFPPQPQFQGGYPFPAPEAPRQEAFTPGNQPSGFVNFEPLPLEPPTSKQAGRTKGFAIPSDGEIKATPGAPESIAGAVSFEKQPAPQQPGDPAARGNEHAVVYPQKQQRPNRPQIDERDYNVYHVDSSQSTFSKPSDLSALSGEDTSTRQAPMPKQQKGFLSKFFNRDD
jgi:signal recognition particle receptor subunit beta